MVPPRATLSDSLSLRGRSGASPAPPASLARALPCAHPAAPASLARAVPSARHWHTPCSSRCATTHNHPTSSPTIDMKPSPPPDPTRTPVRGKARTPLPPMSILQAEGHPAPFRRARANSLARRRGGVVEFRSPGKSPGTTRPMSVSSEGKRPNFPNAKKHARWSAPLGRAFGLLSSSGAWPCLPRRVHPETRSFHQALHLRRMRTPQTDRHEFQRG